MIPVAALLIILVALFTFAIALGTSGPVEANPNGIFDLSIFGARVAVNQMGLYCTGAGSMLVLIIALALLRAGLRRRRFRRRERKSLLTAASGQGQVARKEPSTRVLPGRAGAVDAPGAAGAEPGPSTKSGPLPKPADPTSDEHSAGTSPPS